MKSHAVEIRVGLGSCGVASAVRQALEDAAELAGANGIVKTVGRPTPATASITLESVGQKEPA